MFFEAALWAKSLKSNPSSFISVLALPATSDHLLLSSPGALLLHLNFHASLSPPADSPLLLPVPPPELPSSSAQRHRLITLSIAGIKCEGRPLKSPHNGAQGYLKLSVKTTSRSFTPPHGMVMDVLSDCSIGPPRSQRGGARHPLGEGRVLLSMPRKGFLQRVRM